MNSLIQYLAGVAPIAVSVVVALTYAIRAHAAQETQQLRVEMLEERVVELNRRVAMLTGEAPERVVPKRPDPPAPPPAAVPVPIVVTDFGVGGPSIPVGFRV